MSLMFPLPLGDTSKPEDRVLRLTNVERFVKASLLLSIFKGYNPSSASRGRNSRTRKYNVAYLLFDSQEDRNAAQDLSGTVLKGREITAAHARSGFFFVNGQIVADGENIVDTASAPSSSTIPLPHVGIAGLFPALGGDKWKHGNTGSPVVSWTEWYSFSPTQREKILREQEARGRKVDHTNREAGREKGEMGEE